jgi:lipopolysaccharide export system permease protein
MIGRTLALYFAIRFARTVLAIFLLFVILIAAATYIDIIDRAFSVNNFDAGKAALVVLLRLPAYSEEALPFAVLFGSMTAFFTANRQLEVVVARAAGLSGWQFLLPAVIVGILFGVFATTVYSPFASYLMAQANAIKGQGMLDIGQVFGKKDGGKIWIRQSSADHESIIGAKDAYAEGRTLSDVTAFVFDKQSNFQERVDARSATFGQGEWVIPDATVTSVSKNPEREKTYHLATELGAGDIRQTLDAARNVSFWSLPGLISNAEKSGIPPSGYELRFHSLLARPILLLAMVLVAAIVSLRFSRSMRVGRMIIAGVVVGFVLYVFTSVANDLGGGGIVSPPLAAWLPAIVATLAGTTVLLHLEDG